MAPEKSDSGDLATVPLLIVDDMGMRKLPHTAAEGLVELIMRRYERASTLLTSNRRVDDRGSCLAIPRRDCAPRPAVTSRARPQVRASKLAHQSADRLRTAK